MSYSTFKGTFRSTNKIDRVNYYICEPESDIEAIIQFAHGWLDYFDRNKELIDYFTSHGILVCGCDFIGHNFAEQNESGDFRKKNAWTYLVQDTLKFHHFVTRTYDRIPIYFYGHGLGSIVIRMIMMQNHQYDGVILSGTSGKQHFCRRAEWFSQIIKGFKGPEYHSEIIRKMIQHKVNTHFYGENDEKSWLCSNKEHRYSNNLSMKPSMFYSMGALRDMFYMLKKVSGRKWYQSVDKSIPILLVSGEEDPIGSFGKGVKEVKEKLQKAHCDVTMHLYPAMRHNIQDEDGKEKVFQNILIWIKSCHSYDV